MIASSFVRVNKVVMEIFVIRFSRGYHSGGWGNGYTFPQMSPIMSLFSQGEIQYIWLGLTRLVWLRSCKRRKGRISCTIPIAFKCRVTCYEPLQIRQACIVKGITKFNECCDISLILSISTGCLLGYSSLGIKWNGSYFLVFMGRDIGQEVRKRNLPKRDRQDQLTLFFHFHFEFHPISSPPSTAVPPLNAPPFRFRFSHRRYWESEVVNDGGSISSCDF
ncbi:hypothetical protein RIF29_14319 [Crotalaria pallida]|uniref:Uncharacterized protein n=1 Tax=Crotalaria pallida TaxID=3830 RepID=A0AAN9FGP3_CROPI